MAAATAVNLRRSSAERHLVQVSDEMAMAVSKMIGYDRQTIEFAIETEVEFEFGVEF